MTETTKKPTNGAYVIRPRTDAESAALGIFDWSLRDGNVASPPAQEKVVIKVREFLDLLRDHLPFDSKDKKVIAAIKRYNDEVQNIFRKGCVWEKPQPERACRDLDFLKERVIRGELADKLRNSVVVYTVACLAASVIFAGLAYNCKFVSTNEKVQALGPYLFVVGASMMGIVVSNLGIPAITKVSEYEAQSRLLSLPPLRVIGSAAVSVVIAMLLQYGALTFKLGKFDATQIEESMGTALIVGFIVGVGSSDAIKMIIGLVKRTLK